MTSEKGTHTMIGLIVARSKNNVIGKNGQIPWRIKGEQKQFKELTTGNTVVMGRKSYEEIGHPLPNRMNIVVSNTANYSGENLLTVHSLQEALDAVKEGNVYISGGYGLFKEALSLVDTMYITEVVAEKNITWTNWYDLPAHSRKYVTFNLGDHYDLSKLKKGTYRLYVGYGKKYITFKIK